MLIITRSEVALRIHQEVIARQLHESSDRMYIICDEDFKAVFGQERFTFNSVSTFSLRLSLTLCITRNLSTSASFLLSTLSLLSLLYFILSSFQNFVVICEGFVLS